MAKFQIPIVDFSKLNRNADEFSASLLNALKQYGGAIIRNHGFPVQEARNFQQFVKPFFELPLEQKLKYAQDTKDPVGGLFGYARLGNVRGNPKGEADLVELLQMMGFPETPGDEKWPTKELPGIREKADVMIDKCHGLVVTLLNAIERGLNLQEHFFPDSQSQRGGGFICNYYPPLQGDELPGQIRFGEHKDLLCLTVLFTDGTGGLQAKLSNGDWIDVVQEDDDICIFCGEMMEVLTGDIIKAMVHRVELPEAQYRSKPRLSLGYFYAPPPKALIRPFCGDVGKYEPVTAHEFLQKGNKNFYTEQKYTE